MSRDPDQLEQAVRHLAALERPSASAGEREAARWIAEQLRGLGLDARVEVETAHGGYWWPLGLLSAIAVAGGSAAATGRRPSGWRRLAGLLAGAFAAAGIWDDLGIWRHWFRRGFLPRRETFNVIAQAGDPNASETIVVVAHHDAAHSGAIFNPALPKAIAARFPKLWDRNDTSPPLMYLVFGGPLLVALGSALRRRGAVRLGTALAGGSAAAFADIGLRAVVPGANDNLTGVATLLGLARALRDEPLSGLRVLLVSTGSEESFEEGMQGFAARHFPTLAPQSTRVLVVDTVGSPELILPESEGMLVRRDYDAALKDLISACAADRGISVRRGLRFSFGSDALIALRHGYRTALLGSVNELKEPANYHWPSDHADNVDYDTLADAVRLVEAVARRLAREGAGSDAVSSGPRPSHEPEPAPLHGR